MPIQKCRLSRAKQAECLAAARRLQVLALIPEVPEWLESSRALDIAVAGPESVVCDFPSGMVGYAVRVRLVARSRVTLLDCRITTEWDDQIVLASFDERAPVSKLNWLEYPRSEVLNRRIENSLRFHYRGQMVEGMILASGFKPIPAAYRTGALIPFQLAFTDQFEQELAMEAELFVERTAKRKTAALRPKTGLFDPLRTSESSEAVGSADTARGDS